MKPLATVCTACFLVAGLGLLHAQSGAQAEKLLESARHKEVVDGDLKAASEQYRKIAAQYAKQPELAARALYQLGQCQEKLGQAEARKSYERIVRDYGSAQQYALAARARLAAMGGGGAGREMRARLLWDGPGTRLSYGTSADGRLIATVDQKTGDLAILDLLSGAQRRVTDKGGYGKTSGWVEGNLISPDGSRIAFQWGQEGGSGNSRENYSVRVVHADGTDERVLLKEDNSDTEPQYYEPACWSPDGRRLVVQEFRGRRPFGGMWPHRTLLVSPDNGSVQTLFTFTRSARHGLPGTMRFSPDGRWLAYGAAVAGYGVDQRVSVAMSGLFILPVAETTAGPTEVAAHAGMAGWTPDGKGILFYRFHNTRRELFVLPVENGKAAGEASKIQSVPDFPGWPIALTTSGALIYHVGNETSNSLLADLDVNSGAIGRTVITQPAACHSGGVKCSPRFSPDGKRILFLLPQQRLLIRRFEDGSESTIVPQLKALRLVEWAFDGGSLLVFGVGNDDKAGFYRVEVNSGGASLLASIEDLPPITSFAPSADGKTILYYTPAGFFAVDPRAGNVERLGWDKPAREVHDLRFSHDGKRLALFEGDMVEIVDVRTGTFQRIGSPDMRPGRSGDWSPDDRFLFTLRRGATATLLKLPVDGGAPSKVEFPGNCDGLRLSPDGKSVALLRWTRREQVWALENFLPVMAAPKK